MDDPRPGLTLIVIVLSLILRLNGGILIWTGRKKIPLFPAVLLNILSPVLCLATVSYVTGRTFERDQKSAVKGSVSLILALLFSQFITGMIFVGMIFLMGGTVPGGRALGPGSDASAFTPLHILILVSLSSILLFLMLLIMRPDRDPASFFRGRKLASTSLVSILGLVPLLAVSALLMRLVEEFDPGTAPSLISGVEGTLDIIMVGLSIVVIAPLIEEMLFRGYLHDQLRKHLSPWFTVLITGSLFALVHFNPAALVPIFLMGIFMGWLRERSSSVVPSLVFHSANNLVALLAVILWN